MVEKKWRPISYVVRIGLLLFVTSCSLQGNGVIHTWDTGDLRPIKGTTAPMVIDVSGDIPSEEDTQSIPGSTNVEDESMSGGGHLGLWIDPSLPDSFLQDLIVSEEIFFTLEKDEADYLLAANALCDSEVQWIYALVTPFSSLLEGVSLEVVKSAWLDGDLSHLGGHALLLDAKTNDIFSTVWGAPTKGSVEEFDTDSLLDAAWNRGDVYALIPFEEISPRWKVVSVDAISPLDKDFDISTYPLRVHFCFYTAEGIEIAPKVIVEAMETTNRDESKMTSVLLTGVTALVRATAHKMETKGILYPAEKVFDLFDSVDFAHISNEVAFAADCPYPNPMQADLRFCSSPDYIELLDYLDVDIIELTGNHIQDWSTDAFIETLGIYKQYGMLFYAGGMNETDARRPLLLEHNGNKLAFLGCNAVGPTGAWATDYRSGNADCGDYGWLKEEIIALVDQGYLPIVTLQHNEFYSLQKTSPQMRDFDPLAEIGAVVVSGSQAHYPNPFGFVGDHFIHYGLGNLFFDQIDQYIAPGIQREFVDRHIFYDGEYINTEIYTLFLEDFAQPRLMTPEERALFLDEAFKASGWRTNQ